MKNFLETLMLSLGLLAQKGETEEHPVCIVGAGPAGLTAAAELELKGKSTVIFEKQNSVGGKCQAVYQNGGFSPLGALIFTPPTYRESIKLIVDTDVVSVPFISGEKWQYNSSSGAIWQKPAPPPNFGQLFAMEVGRYIQWWRKSFLLYNMSPGYKHGIPKELTVTTAEWLATNKYQTLQILFVQTMVAYGYGDYRQVPIIYMLQYLTPDVTMALLKVQQGAKVDIVDFHKVFVRYAEKHIKGPIHLGTTISQIDRSSTYPVIKYHDSQDSERKSKTQECSALILAFPPTLPALEATHLDLSVDERAVFSRVGTNSFYSGAVHMKTPRSMTFGAASLHPALPPDPAGDPVVFVKLHSDLDVAITSSWGPYRGNVTKAEAYSRLKGALSKFNKDPRDNQSMPLPITDSDVLAFQDNDYFPHFDSEQLAAGFYNRFDDLQGGRKTYFASGFNMFELVEYAIRAGQDVVKTYF